jgi:hypothetical protein
MGEKVWEGEQKQALFLLWRFSYFFFFPSGLGTDCDDTAVLCTHVFMRFA